jgi:hypothetical protein
VFSLSGGRTAAIVRAVVNSSPFSSQTFFPKSPSASASTTMPLLHPIQWLQGRPSAVPAEWDPHTPVYLAVLAHKQRGKTLPIPLWCVPHYHPVRIVQPWNGVAVDPSQRQWWCSRDGITWGVCPQPQPWHFWLQALSFQKDQGV